MVEAALDTIQVETEHIFSQDWPVTPLSLAIQLGHASIIRLLAERSAPRSLGDAISFKKRQREEQLWGIHDSPNFGVAWDFSVKNPITTSMDAISASLSWNEADEVVRVLLEDRVAMVSNISTSGQGAEIQSQGRISGPIGSDVLLAASQGLANEKKHGASSTIESPITESYALVAEHLLEHGANPNPKPMKQYFGTRRAFLRGPASLPQFSSLLLWPLNQHQSIEVVLEVLEYNIPINAADSYGYRPIHNCVLDGTAEMLRLLIHNGADINANTNFGISVLLMAVSIGKGEIIGTLL
ncbi:hypothetical protein AK830_g73 [Neonectria ditissima]|uniref:Uncharacterized protein n=1 Tax=Neonectria ditissima TaxID=78410 RepID=A0A0P7BHG4_9HYPO|nr:hypothetical protein AK830_g73 [Neonectria ditissima]